MKKLILILLLIAFASPAYALSGAIQAVIGAGGTASAATDSCTSGLLFSWHMEDTDVTLGGVAGGVNNGCSAGDTTATATGTPSLDASVYKDGAKAVKIVSAATNQYYAFDWSSSDIVSPTAGTVDLWFYYTGTLGAKQLFYLIVDGNNRIYAAFDANGYVALIHIAGGTASMGRTTFPILSESTWYHLKARWDTTAHSTLYIKVTCDETTGESNDAGVGTTALGTWAGTSGIWRFGDDGNGTGMTIYIDNVKVYNSWQ